MRRAICGGPLLQQLVGNFRQHKNYRIRNIELNRLANETEVVRERLEALNAECRGLFDTFEPMVGILSPGLCSPAQSFSAMCVRCEELRSM
jgi:hypothetical protein